MLDREVFQKERKEMTDTVRKPMHVILMTRLMERIARNFQDVKLWDRNAKVLVATEALWGVPMTWVFFYQVIFMRSLGMNEVFIGLSAMLPLTFQLFLPMLGGYLADRFGRKRVLMLFDTVSWIGAMMMWLIASESWHVIAAMIFQGLGTTIYGVWETLLVEDTESPYRVSVYSFIQLVYIVGGILTPIAGAVISLYGIEQGSRYLFLTSLLTIAIMFAIRQIYLGESKMGKMLSSSDREGQLRSGGYQTALEAIAKHRRLLILFIISTIGSIQYPLVNTYKPLYLTDLRGLALDESIASIIPMASSIPSLVALTFIVPRLKYTHIKKALLFSYACGLLGFIALVVAPAGSLPLPILSAILDSARFIAVFSISRVFLVNLIDEVNPYARAKIMSLTVTVSALASWPAPLIGGYLYTAGPALPFVLTAILLVFSMLLVLKI